MTRAARLQHHGDPLVIQDVDLAPPGADEVLVRLAYGGLNPIDRYGAEGRVAMDGPLPRTLGGEASGHLDGRPVLVTGAGLGSSRDGVWATEAVVPRSAVVELPADADLQEAAALGIAGLTAYNVAVLAGVTSEDRVLVLGAAGGVGLPLVGYLAALGATVWGQTGSESKASAITDQGAERAVVTGADGLADAVAELAPTVVFDPLGGTFTAPALVALQARGRYVVYGTSAGAEVSLNLQGVYRKAIRVLGYGGGQISGAEHRAGLQAAVAELAAGRLTVPVGRVVPLAEVNDAMALLIGRAVVGKIVLDLS